MIRVLVATAIAASTTACSNISNECLTTLSNDLVAITDTAVGAGGGSSATYNCPGGGTAVVSRNYGATVGFSSCIVQGASSLLEITSGTLDLTSVNQPTEISGTVIFMGSEDACSEQFDTSCMVDLKVDANSTTGTLCDLSF